MSEKVGWHLGIFFWTVVEFIVVEVRSIRGRLDCDWVDAGLGSWFLSLECNTYL